MFIYTSIILHIAIQMFALIEQTDGHGRLLEPPARNTLWRFGYKSPPNYNDNELFCGGIGGITRNEGKCGICGDSYDGVRLHETGHQMAMNVTTRNFFPGSSIEIMLEIVANHGGQFTFEMCWRDSWDLAEKEDCFEPLKLKQEISNYPTNEPTTEKISNEETTNNPSLDELQIVDDLYHYDLSSSAGTGIFTMAVELPIEKSCENCVFRWHWKSANNWGVCEDGSERVGCGYQEVYRNCADISVKRTGAGVGFGQRRRRRRRR